MQHSINLFYTCWCWFYDVLITHINKRFWLTWKNWVYVMISVRPASWVSLRGKNFNVVIFSDTPIKLCMMVVLIELYLFMPLSVTLIVFQGLSRAKQLYLKMLCAYLIKLKLYNCWLCHADHEYFTIFDFSTCSREMIDIISSSEKTL